MEKNSHQVLDEISKWMIFLWHAHFLNISLFRITFIYSSLILLNFIYSDLFFILFFYVCIIILCVLCLACWLCWTFLFTWKIYTLYSLSLREWIMLSINESHGVLFSSNKCLRMIPGLFSQLITFVLFFYTIGLSLLLIFP